MVSLGNGKWIVPVKYDRSAAIILRKKKGQTALWKSFLITKGIATKLWK